MSIINGKHIDLHDIIENDGVECTNCGMEISDEEQFEFKDHTYCCDCIVGALVNEGYIKQIK